MSRQPESPREQIEGAAAGMHLEEASYADAAEFCDNVDRRRVLFPDENPNRMFRDRHIRWMARPGNHAQRDGHKHENPHAIQR